MFFYLFDLDFPQFFRVLVESGERSKNSDAITVSITVTKQNSKDTRVDVNWNTW